jgi:CMP-N,N'-diacetyllegionaminic acid synthase
VKILALITARGGSKRLPNKNIKELGGKPLIAWSLDTVSDVTDVCDVLVSTDDIMIKEVAMQYGASIPWLRPDVLATDTASSVDVALHALNWYETNIEKVDGLMLLQPTSPFRTRETILKGIDIFRGNGCQSVIAVSHIHAHPKWAFTIENKLLLPYLNEHSLNIRSQDLDPAYVVNGSFYLISPDRLKAQHSFYGDNTLPLLIESNVESLDIDTLDDWQYAEFCLSKISNNP